MRAAAVAMRAFSLLKIQSPSAPISSSATSSSLRFPDQPSAGSNRCWGRAAADASASMVNMSPLSSLSNTALAALVASSAQGGGILLTACTGASAKSTSQNAFIVGPSASSRSTSPPFS